LGDKFTTLKDAYECLIFNHTDIGKRGKKIEGVFKIFDHVDHCLIFGLKLLVAGYWNASVFILIDFSFHRENKDNKKYSLSKKQQNQQKENHKEQGAQIKKTGILVDMFKRINQRKIEVDYILTDS
jgi:hypothetical protein